MTAPPDLPADKPFQAKRIIQAVLVVQLAIAVIVFGADLLPSLGNLISPSNAPDLTQPASPGDQTRRYTPRDLPARTPNPGSRPIPANTDMPDRLAFQFTTWEGAPALTLTGRIAEGDAGRFADALASRDAPKIVFLNSPGGSVMDALEIGRDLRILDVTTQLTASDICLSACPLLFAAGTTRIADDDAWLGVHQSYFGENTVLPAFLAVDNIQRGQAKVIGYFYDMGVDLRIMQPAMSTPPDEIYLLTPQERADYNLTTPLPE
ncbi:MAG: hypothetical protein ACI86S_001206 [Paracoccaceae bacterium]|jgi:hypothetical protein